MVPPSGTPRRVLYPGPPGLPTGTHYAVVGEVALVQNPPTAAGPNEQGRGSRPTSSGRALEKERSGALEKTRSSQVQRKNTGSVQSGRGQSPVPRRTSDQSRAPDRARTPVRHRTPDRGKAPVTQASPSSPPDCQMVEPFARAESPQSRAGGIQNRAPEAIPPQFGETEVPDFPRLGFFKAVVWAATFNLGI